MSINKEKPSEFPDPGKGGGQENQKLEEVLPSFVNVWNLT